MAAGMRAPEPGDRWLLRSGSERVGTLQLSEIDQPWFRCEFTPADSWKDFRPIFERLSAAVDRGSDAEVAEAFKEFRDLKLRLIAATQEGLNIDPVILQIREEKVALFRY
ncbi:hypothetical protein [Streptomyces parvulus]|uniref:hypothetical protein n=1 Tax=Streptomyces parvulus TaxID=146923 RepID=UPI001CFA8498|nr:hypothetical protein [Streptomyces parvulus]